MSTLTKVTAREANHRFAQLLRAVETEGRGFLVLKRGRPVARIVPAEADDKLTPDQRAALERLLASAKPLGIDRLNRDELHERR